MKILKQIRGNFCWNVVPSLTLPGTVDFQGGFYISPCVFDEIFVKLYFFHKVFFRGNSRFSKKIDFFHGDNFSLPPPFPAGEKLCQKKVVFSKKFLGGAFFLSNRNKQFEIWQILFSQAYVLFFENKYLGIRLEMPKRNNSRSKNTLKKRTIGCQKKLIGIFCRNQSNHRFLLVFPVKKNLTRIFYRNWSGDRFLLVFPVKKNLTGIFYRNRSSDRFL